jgi:hypothetical protein
VAASDPLNWRGAHNPWSLPMPPRWWLQRLWNRDRALLVLPGIKECCYRIARRSHAMADATAILGNDSETARMIRERCVPVTNLRPGVTWNDDFFVWLDQHDSWAFKDPAQRLDDIDRETAARLDAHIADECDQRSVSAYHSMQMRTGQRVFVHQPSWSLSQSVARLPVARGPALGDLSNGSLPDGCKHRQTENASGNP